MSVVMNDQAVNCGVPNSPISDKSKVGTGHQNQLLQ